MQPKPESKLQMNKKDSMKTAVSFGAKRELSSGAKREPSENTGDFKVSDSWRTDMV